MLTRLQGFLEGTAAVDVDLFVHDKTGAFG